MKSRPRPWSGLRWLLLVHLALGLMVQPIFGLAGDLHAQGHLQQEAAGSSEAGPAPGERGIAAALHQLHSLVPCCSHAVATPHITLQVPQGDLHTPVARAEARALPHGRWAAPFRPPIAG